MKSLEERKADRAKRAAENAAEGDVKPVHVEEAQAIASGKGAKPKAKTKAETVAEAAEKAEADAQAKAEADEKAAREAAANGGNGGGAAPASWTPPAA